MQVFSTLDRELFASWTDIEIDDSQYTYGPRKSQPSEPESQTTELDTCDSNTSTEPSELVSEPVVDESYIEVQPKVWSDAPIIEEYESDSDDEHVCVHTEGLNTPSFANKQVKTPRENVKNQSTHSQKPKIGLSVKLAKQVELHKQNMTKGNGIGVRKPTWNNVQRVNKQNQFVPLAVQTRTGINPVNTAKASSTNNFSTARQKVNKQTVLTSTALKVNNVKPIVNDVRPANVFHKTHSPSSRPFKSTTVQRTSFSNQKVYTVKVKEVSTVGGKWDTAVKSSADSAQQGLGPMRSNSLSFYIVKDNPHRSLKNKGIIDSGCSRHMTGNKAYLADFQDFNGGPVAFGGSKGYITGKGKIKTGKLDFEDVSFVKELQPFNLFSVSQMCDKKNKVLFTDTECLVLSPDFKLPDENQILLKVPRQNNMYSFNLENIVPLGGLACLIAKATTDESNLWHRRLGHYLQPFQYHGSRGNTAMPESPKQMSCGEKERVLVTKPHNKTPYELLTGRGPNWLFDLDYLTDSMNYHNGRSENQANLHAGQQETNQNTGTKDKIDAGDSKKEDESAQDCFELPIWHSYSSTNLFASKSDTKRGEKEAKRKLKLSGRTLEQETKNLVTQAGAAKSSILRFKSFGILVDLPYGKKGYRDTGQKEGIDYDESVCSMVWLEAKDLFSICLIIWALSLSMDVKRHFSWQDLMKSSPEIVKQKPDGIFSQDKYVAGNPEEVIGLCSVRLLFGTPIETQKPLVKDEEASDVDVHLYRSMIGSLMYVTASRPDIMFTICACSRFQVTPKTSHLSAVKRIFRYLKGKPKLGLWYPRVSSLTWNPIRLVDYAWSKSSTGIHNREVVQFLADDLLIRNAKSKPLWPLL
ncbi:hypothetical protein Tco_0768097 [Tanacetum coccineum]